jgi:hypothetical protein
MSTTDEMFFNNRARLIEQCFSSKASGFSGAAADSFSLLMRPHRVNNNSSSVSIMSEEHIGERWEEKLAERTVSSLLLRGGSTDTSTPDNNSCVSSVIGDDIGCVDQYSSLLRQFLQPLMIPHRSIDSITKKIDDWTKWNVEKHTGYDHQNRSYLASIISPLIRFDSKRCFSFAKAAYETLDSLNKAFVKEATSMQKCFATQLAPFLNHNASSSAAHKTTTPEQVSSVGSSEIRDLSEVLTSYLGLMTLWTIL